MGFDSALGYWLGRNPHDFAHCIVLTALKFFKLIDETGTPTNDFKILVEEKDDDKRKSEWKRIVEKSYDFIFNGTLDLQRATESQIHEKFRDKGLDGATLRKCHTFFSNAAQSAGIVLGPHANSSTKGNSAARLTSARKNGRRKIANGGSAGNGATVPPAPQAPVAPSSNRGMREILMDKFPPFDPTWNDDLKAKWFEGFEKLLKSADVSP